jgi:hypothetical protein
VSLYVFLSKKNLKLNDEPVKAKGGYAENECEYDNELDGMFVKIVIGLTVRELATDNCAYE